jgi:hypothetical protein
MRKLTTPLGLVLILVLGLVVTVGRPEPARAADGDNLVLVWNDQTLEAIRKLPPAPTVAARALAIVHTAIYDAWAAYDPLAVGTRPGGGAAPARGGTDPGQQGQGDQLRRLHRPGGPVPGPPVGLHRQDAAALWRGVRYRHQHPATIGFTAAQAVLDFRHTDGANQANGYADTSGYTPVNTWNQILSPDHWQPLCVPCPHQGPPTAPPSKSSPPRTGAA